MQQDKNVLVKRMHQPVGTFSTFPFTVSALNFWVNRATRSQKIYSGFPPIVVWEPLVCYRWSCCHLFNECLTLWNSPTPIGLFQSSAVTWHIIQSQMTVCWSILWLGAGRKKSFTVCRLLVWKPVGQCDTKHFWFDREITVHADREWSLKHKLLFMSMGGRGVSNSPIREQLSVIGFYSREEWDVRR